MQPINIVIADDHEVVITGLQQMLNNTKHMRVICCYNYGKALLDGLKNNSLPDVLLLDIQMPDMNGDELAAIISTTYPTIRILTMTAFNMTKYVKTMLQNGAMGYLLKNTDKATLIEAIETVHKGQQYIDRSLKEQLLEDYIEAQRQPTYPPLTRREKDILELIVEAYTNAMIAQKLFLSIRTIEHYRANLMQKLNVKNTIGLVKVALQHDLLK